MSSFLKKTGKNFQLLAYSRGIVYSNGIIDNNRSIDLKIEKNE